MLFDPIRFTAFFAQGTSDLPRRLLHRSQCQENPSHWEARCDLPPPFRESLRQPAFGRSDSLRAKGNLKSARRPSTGSLTEIRAHFCANRSRKFQISVALVGDSARFCLTRPLIQQPAPRMAAESKLARNSCQKHLKCAAETNSEIERRTSKGSGLRNKRVAASSDFRGSAMIASTSGTIFQIFSDLLSGCRDRDMSIGSAAFDFLHGRHTHSGVPEPIAAPNQIRNGLRADCLAQRHRGLVPLQQKIGKRSFPAIVDPEPVLRARRNCCSRFVDASRSDSIEVAVPLDWGLDHRAPARKSVSVHGHPPSCAFVRRASKAGNGVRRRDGGQKTASSDAAVASVVGHKELRCRRRCGATRWLCQNLGWRSKTSRPNEPGGPLRAGNKRVLQPLINGRFSIFRNNVREQLSESSHKPIWLSRRTTGCFCETDPRCARNLLPRLSRGSFRSAFPRFSR